MPDRAATPDTASAQRYDLRPLAERWNVPAAHLAQLVCADGADADGGIVLNQWQVDFVRCLQEIDLTLLVSCGPARRLLRQRRKGELHGKSPLEFLRPCDLAAASTVLRVLTRRCEKLPRGRDRASTVSTSL